jgi:hypothetical protein
MAGRAEGITGHGKAGCGGEVISDTSVRFFLPFDIVCQLALNFLTGHAVHCPAPDIRCVKTEFPRHGQPGLASALMAPALRNVALRALLERS